MRTNASDPAIDLKAVILDYGEVLCARPGAEEFRRMAETLGMSLDSFVEHWEQSRPPYDRGDLTPEEYWQKFARDNGKVVVAAQIEKLRQWEIEMWTCVNPSMVAWMQNLSAIGMKTALLSNMHADLAGHMEKNFEWMGSFTLRIFSAHVKLVKPDRAIYEHILQALGAKAEETLFVDDREVNIKAARALGMHAIQFRSVADLRDELAGLGLAVVPVGE